MMATSRSDDFKLDPRFIAGVELLQRTGARDFRIGWSDEDEGPVAFYAVCSWHQGAEAAASLDPVKAVMRLCELVIDGGTCTHCGRPTIFDPDPPGPFDEMLDAMGCRYKWEPDSAAFVRSCQR
jgi:hypothetical protein